VVEGDVMNQKGSNALYVVIRIKGESGLKPDEEKTLELLRLTRKFAATVVKNTPSIRGMLKKLEYVVTYGEINEDTLAKLIEKRGRLIGNKRVTREYLQNLGFKDYKELAKALLEGKIDLKSLPELKPEFRLHPPWGGFKGTIKKHYRVGGELGYRGKDINKLLLKMI